MIGTPNYNIRCSKLNGDDAKSHVSMRGDDEPTATTQMANGYTTRCNKLPGSTAVDVLDTEDMTFDLIAQNTAFAHGDQHFKD